jgi:hypothetical protein
VARELSPAQEEELDSITDPHARLQKQLQFQKRNEAEFVAVLAEDEDATGVQEGPGAITGLSPKQRELLWFIESPKTRRQMAIVFKGRNEAEGADVEGAETWAERATRVPATPARATAAKSAGLIPLPKFAAPSLATGIELPHGALRLDETTNPSDSAKILAMLAQQRHYTPQAPETVGWDGELYQTMGADLIRKQVTNQLTAKGYSGIAEIPVSTTKNPDGTTTTEKLLIATKNGRLLLGLWLIHDRLAILTWRQNVPLANTARPADNSGRNSDGSSKNPGDYYYPPTDGSENHNDMIARMARAREQENRENKTPSHSAQQERDAVNRVIRDYGAPKVHDLNMGRINPRG